MHRWLQRLQHGEGHRSFFQVFLGAVKNGSSLSPAMAKQVTLYSIVAWPDSFLALEQLCALFS